MGITRVRFGRGTRCQGGLVTLVGAGPGDPELLTLKAWRALRHADVVVHDHLVSPGIVAMARRGAKRIYVGKESGAHTLPQDEINALLVEQALAGRRVVRLKGGDPFVFGRGGEEIEALAARGVAFEVIPGITAATGAAAYAGIPLTHRDCADSCVFVTGHASDGHAPPDWKGLVRPRQTLVVYMGIARLDATREALIAHGMPGSTACAIVESATTAEQRVVEATLDSLARVAREEEIRPPALLIIGEVVRHRVFPEPLASRDTARARPAPAQLSLA